MLLATDKRSFVSVPIDHIDKIWPLIDELVDRALRYAHGELTKDQVKGYLKSADMQLWAVIDEEEKKVLMIVITAVTDMPNFKVCRVALTSGGSVGMWRIASEHIEDWARSQGCQRLDAYTRPGVAKTMKRSGWTQLYTVIGKDLGDGDGQTED